MYESCDLREKSRTGGAGFPANGIREWRNPLFRFNSIVFYENRGRKTGLIWFGPFGILGLHAFEGLNT